MKPKKAGRCALIAAAALSAAAIVAQLARAQPSGLVALPPEIERLYNAGSYSRAAEVLQATIAQNPKDASHYYYWHYYWLGRCYFEVRDFNRAISTWERAVALEPGRSEYHDWLGRAYGRKADESSHSNMAAAFSLARRTHKEFETAVRLDSTNISAQRDLIDFMANAPGELGGGEGRALEQIRALSAVDPMEGQLALADLYAVRKKFEQASNAYQEVLKSAPNRIDAYFEIADYYRDRSDSEHMDQAVEAAAKIDPSDRRLSYYRGVVLVLENRNAEAAEKDLRSYIDSVPDNSEVPEHSSAYAWLGRLFENEKKPDLAAQQYEAALALDPRNKTLREDLKRVQKK
ncbi:MAG: tetratricopeptide repeat protein [Candidatus Sulfotelmatobacter sp.]